MKTIWKFPIRLTDEQLVTMPRDSAALSCQMQDGQLCLWAFVESDAPMETRTVRIVGTGHPLDEGGEQFIDTVQDGRLVWHVFID